MKKRMVISIAILLVLCFVACSPKQEIVRVSGIKLTTYTDCVRGEYDAIPLNVGTFTPDYATNKQVVFELDDPTKDIDGYELQELVSVSPTGLVTFTTSSSILDTLHFIFTVTVKSTDVASVSDTATIYVNYVIPSELIVSIKDAPVVTTDTDGAVESVSLYTSKDSAYSGNKTAEIELDFDTYEFPGVTYASSNPDVATVSDSGEICAIAAGSTKITIESTEAYASGNYATRSFDVYVNRITTESELRAFLNDDTYTAKKGSESCLLSADSAYLESDLTLYKPVKITVDKTGYDKTLILQNLSATDAVNTKIVFDVDTLDYNTPVYLKTYATDTNLTIKGGSATGAQSSIKFNNLENSNNAYLFDFRCYDADTSNVTLTFDNVKLEAKGVNALPVYSQGDVNLTDTTVIAEAKQVASAVEMGSWNRTLTVKNSDLSAKGYNAYGIYQYRYDNTWAGAGLFVNDSKITVEAYVTDTPVTSGSDVKTCDAYGINYTLAYSAKSNGINVNSTTIKSTAVDYANCLYLDAPEVGYTTASSLKASDFEGVLNVLLFNVNAEAKSDTTVDSENKIATALYMYNGNAYVNGGSYKATGHKAYATSFGDVHSIQVNETNFQAYGDYSNGLCVYDNEYYFGSNTKAISTLGFEETIGSYAYISGCTVEAKEIDNTTNGTEAYGIYLGCINEEASNGNKISYNTKVTVSADKAIGVQVYAEVPFTVQNTTVDAYSDVYACAFDVVKASEGLTANDNTFNVYNAEKGFGINNIGTCSNLVGSGNSVKLNKVQTGCGMLNLKGEASLTNTNIVISESDLREGSVDFNESDVLDAYTDALDDSYLEGYGSTYDFPTVIAGVMNAGKCVFDGLTLNIDNVGLTGTTDVYGVYNFADSSVDFNDNDVNVLVKTSRGGASALYNNGKIVMNNLEDSVFKTVRTSTTSVSEEKIYGLYNTDGKNALGIVDDKSGLVFDGCTSISFIADAGASVSTKGNKLGYAYCKNSSSYPLTFDPVFTN